MKRAIVLVLDSFGIGSTKDAHHYADEGANTLGHIAKACFEEKVQGKRQALNLPVLSQLGLLHSAYQATGEYPQGLVLPEKLIGAYGCASEISTGKDTVSGHWEMMGVPVLFDWGYFKNRSLSFPDELLKTIISKANLEGVLGNCHASGTKILNQLGEEHIKTGQPIMYTSADSVIQIACHEEFFGLNKLYQLCEMVRELIESYCIARVIARPFIGDKKGEFKRTGHRKDYTLPPPQATLLEQLVSQGKQVVAIGKIADIFAHRGVSQVIKANTLESLFSATVNALQVASDETLIMTNFSDFDSLYGHRRDIFGYANALEQFDQMLPVLLKNMKKNDMLIVTADHGCDPSWLGTDHTREQIPILVYGHMIQPQCFGHRESFSDIGQSLASFFNVPPLQYGNSFL